MAFWPQNASVFGNSVFIDPSGDTGVVRTYYCKASAMHTGLESRKLAKMLFVCFCLFQGWDGPMGLTTDYGHPMKAKIKDI